MFDKKIKPLDDGKTINFEITTELGVFSGKLSPTDDGPNRLYRNTWLLTIDYRKTMTSEENSGKEIKHADYYSKAEKLAKRIIELYGLHLSEDYSDKEKIELIVYRR